ncbi:hypothetical protein L218DRAFT_955976 [Marasmius fiardii PR-910]|nr:hypothetical protein L218DRAFT_955976 [Marasmius fiardii PR-910]
METIFTRNKFLYLAPQVEELEVNFMYSDDTDPMVVRAIKTRTWDSFDIPRDTMLHVKKLRVFGTSIGVASELLEACGGIRNLEVFEQDAWRVEERALGAPLMDTDVYDSESESDSEVEEDGEEVFYDCPDSDIDIEERSWETYEEVLKSSLSKEELSRLLNVFQRQLVV